jgi:heme-degrading monooxygenase HmoA
MSRGWNLQLDPGAYAKAMLVRYFTATVTRANAPKYYTFFRNTLTPELERIPGHRGALVLSADDESDPVDITVLTFWESQEAIRKFAGDTPRRAVVEPEARELLASFSEVVSQHVVEVDTLQRGL